MLEPFRSEFNAQWTPEKYAELLQRLNEKTGTTIEFRVAETPCFFPRELMEQMVRAGEELTYQLVRNPAYMRMAEQAIPEAFRVPGCDAHPHFMTVDFGLVRGEDGELRPKLVEMQAFPSIFGYQPMLSREYADVYGVGRELEYLFGGMDEEQYWSLMREVIVGRHDPRHVVLLEVHPEQQKTLPDFRMHEQRLGIRTVDLTEVVKKGNKLYYPERGTGAEPELVPIHRIYNRVIVDELERKGIVPPFDYRDALDVEWAGHPNWYFKISKFSIPYLRHPTVPAAVFLDEYFRGEGRDRLPADRQNWVFKPLYSFAGKGIQFGPSDAELEAIPEAERGNYLLQERVFFEPVIQTPEGMTQAEVRILYVWPDGGEMVPMTSLVRMGRGMMMGVDHNRDRTWVGGSAGLFPRDVDEDVDADEDEDGVSSREESSEVQSVHHQHRKRTGLASKRGRATAASDEPRDPVRAAVRFPLHLNLTIESEKGPIHALTEDVSSNGILFVAEELPALNSRVEFRLRMPAAVLGSAKDVTLQCVGKVVRHQRTDGKNMAAVEIHQYSLKAEHQ